VTTVDDDVYKFSMESDNEIEKGSNKLVVTFPNSEPKTYSSNWYFNYDDFKTKGNKMLFKWITGKIALYVVTV